MRDRHNDILDLSRRELMAYAGAAALTAGTALGSATLANAQAKTRFVFANESDYDTADPHAAFDVGRVAIRLNIYDGLMRWQNNPAVLEPWVAENHTISPDGLIYTFMMRKGVKFHDGTEVKAQDVVYSLERILAVGKGAASLFKTMIGSRRRQSDRRLYRRVQAGESFGDFPLDRAGDSHRQRRAGEEEREERRQRRSLAVEELGRLRSLQDHAVRSGHRICCRTLPGPFQGLGPEMDRRDRVPRASRTPTPACSA